MENPKIHGGGAILNNVQVKKNDITVESIFNRIKVKSPYQIKGICQSILTKIKGNKEK